MSTLSKTTFETTYVDTAGTFADNTTRLITEGDLRQFADDVADSLLFTDTLQNTNVEDVGSATKVPSTFILGAQKKQVLITSAQVLTGNSVPIELIAGPDPGQDCVIIPLMFIVIMRYGSAAYATNTSFRFELNGVAVTASNTTVLPATTNKFVMMPVIGYDNSSIPSTSALTFEVQTGNPTAGNSDILVTVIYSVIADEEI